MTDETVEVLGGVFRRAVSVNGTYWDHLQYPVSLHKTVLGNWCAYVQGSTDVRGYGETKEQALSDLLDLVEEAAKRDLMLVQSFNRGLAKAANSSYPKLGLDMKQVQKPGTSEEKNDE